MNLKSFLFSGLLALLSVTFVYGQSDVTKKGNVTIGVRGGLSMPGFTGGSDNPLSKGYSTITRYGFGVFAEFKLSDLFSIQPMLEYSQEGGKKNGYQALQPIPANQGAMLSLMNNGTVPEFLSANVNNQSKLNYLQLPVLAKFGWDLDHQQRWRIYVDAGPYAALLVGAKQIISVPSGSAILYMTPNDQIPLPEIDPNTQMPVFDQSGNMVPTQITNTTTNTKSSLNTFNWGFEGNVGLQYQISAKNRVFIEGGGNYGLKNIQKDAIDGSNHIGAATVMVGYGYTL